MGSSSVYCNFSKITITHGDDCVLVPLSKANHSEAIAYSGYYVYSLPIFGKYNDYQGIEDIENSESNLIIEKYFGISIQEFCDKLTEYSPDFDENIEWHGKIKNLEYCWVHRKVWDLLTTYKPSNMFLRVDSFDMGNQRILEKLGFKYVGLDASKERYKKAYQFKNEIFYSDGTWLEGQIYSMSDLKEKIDIDTSFFDGKESQDIFDIQTKSEKIKHLYGCLGFRHFSTYNDDDDDDFSDYDLRKLNEFKRLYLDEIDNPVILKGLSDLTTVVINTYYFSEYFKPNNPLCTPQCGEHAHHQVFLNEFCRINQEIVNALQ